ncbi:MAG TPA: hypothetical protein VN711_03205 [Candidatus Saccharimonadales bacterium]|nr:hypothetical protein [Candidatus Saccharimonadales bacterium]
MPKSSLPTINLAKNRGEKFVDRFLSWALTGGRALVIVTEAIALGAFLYRFGLDRQLLDLHDKITQEQAIVKLLQNNETTYRNLQDRLSLIATLTKENAQQLKTYQDISSFVPPSMTIVNLSSTDTTISFDGTVSSLVALSSFINKVKTYPSVSSVSLDKLDNKAATGTLTVGITITLKAPVIPNI